MELEEAWWLWGVAAAVGVVAFRPLAKGAIKGYFAARDGVTRWTTATRNGIRNLYQEAAAEYQGTVSPPPARSRRGPRRPTPPPPEPR